MQRNDYQDALNELRLSSKFCEEMEKKLSAQVTEDDEYTDEVTLGRSILNRTIFEGK